MKFNITQKEIENHISGVLTSYFGVKAEDASKAQIYRATCMVIRDLLTSERVNFKKSAAPKTQNKSTICQWNSCSGDPFATIFSTWVSPTR